jgi:hypothetical protein
MIKYAAVFFRHSIEVKCAGIVAHLNKNEKPGSFKTGQVFPTSNLAKVNKKTAL